MPPFLSRSFLLLPLLLALAGVFGPTGAQSVKSPAPKLALGKAQVDGLEAVLRRARGVHLGLLVTDAQSGRVLYARSPDDLFVPASNMKLLSLGAALYRLGPDYWFSTTITRPPITRLGSARPAGEVASADHLTLVGSGDPSLEVTSGEHSLAGLARQVYRSGLRTVGDLRLDAHLIGAEAGTQEAGWAVPVVERPVTGLSLNDPSAGEGTRLTTRPDAQRALLRLGQTFSAELQRAGVKVTGRIVVLDGPPSVAPEEGVATTRSAALAVLVRSALKRSDNVWTEQLYARLGVNTGTPLWRAASPEYARQQQFQWLRQAGISGAGLVIQDGSGLSGRNRLSPRAVAGLLRYVYLHPLESPQAPGTLTPEAAFRARRNLLIEALPRAGTGTASQAVRLTGGTLARRLNGLDVRAKTGTLPGVCALSGYLTTRSGRGLIFSVLMDGYGGPGQELRQMQDALLRVLAQGG